LTLNHVSNATFKPVILVTLVGVAIYTYTKKDFGQHKNTSLSRRQRLVRGVSIGMVLGFYDGFIGPGTGSFLLLLFISAFGLDFIHASAHAKIVNLATNLASIAYFSITGQIMYKLALPMAVCNMAGGFAGSRFALLKGNKFIRIFFLFIVCATILRFAYDIFL